MADKIVRSTMVPIIGTAPLVVHRCGGAVVAFETVTVAVDYDTGIEVLR